VDGPRADLDRTTALKQARLRGLVADRWGGDHEREALTAGTAAALVEDGPDGRRGWVLVDEAADRALGPALVWGERHGVDELHLLVDDGAGTVARQASHFADGPAVWRVDGTALVPAPPDPPPRPAPAPAPPELVDLLNDAGLEVVVEGGMVRGEVDGLEVARIVHGRTTAGVPIDGPQLEVGVGKADRELTAVVHGELSLAAQLERVVAIVREHRRPGAPRHPLNQLVPDRWLRAVLCRNPALVGLASLRPAETTRPRPNLSVRDLAAAVGETDDGRRVVVVCAVGIALDLVPLAADTRAALDEAAGDGRRSGLVLAVPARDDHPTVRRLAARMHDPADIVALEGDWRAAG
jgi:hypothetical protein